MSRNQKSNKESKKKPRSTAKEKRAAKRAKDTGNLPLGIVFENNKNPHHQRH